MAYFKTCMNYKVLFILTLLVFSLVANAYAQNTCIDFKKKNMVDICLKKQIKVLDEELSGLLLNVSDKKFYSQEDIEKQVAALKNYRKSFCEFVSNRYESKAHRDSNYSTCYIGITKLWISELK